MADLVAGGLRPARAPAYGARIMAVTGHSLASLAAVRAFERGGSVADAMIAASAVLSVVIPHATSLGGDAFILYHDAKQRRTHALNASGPAPTLATPDRFAGGMAARGPLSALVPGMVRGWQEVHARYGKLPWNTLFDDAIALARDGHPLSLVLGANLLYFRQLVSDDPGLSGLYMPRGEPLKPGEMLKQKALAKTLEAIRDGGADAFYGGKVAGKLAAYVTKRGGLLSADDMAGYAPLWSDPIETVYRGVTVQVIPPTSYGILLLLQLNALEGLRPGALITDDATRLARLMSAARAAFDAGHRHIADPASYDAPIAELLGGETTRQLRAALENGAAAPRVANRGGTSCITIADADGNAVTVVQSVFAVFGSGVLDPGTGILLNNRMRGFTTEAGHPNLVAPGKRPAHTLSPTMMLKDGRVRYQIVSPGQLNQTITVTQVLTNMLERGLTLAEAAEAPRWCLDDDGEARIEDFFPESVQTKLAALGHPVRRVHTGTPFGSVKAIEVLPGGALQGVADFRREAFALGA